MLNVVTNKHPIIMTAFENFTEYMLASYVSANPQIISSSISLYVAALLFGSLVTTLRSCSG